MLISCFTISPMPASSLTLQYFGVDKRNVVSYKTFKVYVPTIRMMHIEDGIPDPTIDETLHLICRGIHW